MSLWHSPCNIITWCNILQWHLLVFSGAYISLCEVLRSVMNQILECENVTIWTTKPVDNRLHGHCKFSFYPVYLLKGMGDIILSNIFWTYSFCKHLTRRMFCNTKGKLNRSKPPSSVGLTVSTFTDFVTVLKYIKI